jgi:5-methylcytosine-specific restriction endonuclease McrA
MPIKKKAATKKPAKARNYRDEYDKYHKKEVQKKRRAKRNSARNEKMKTGAVKKGDGKDVDHKTPLSKGGSNKASNLRVKSKSANRSFARTKTGAMKKK